MYYSTNLFIFDQIILPFFVNDLKSCIIVVEQLLYRGDPVRRWQDLSCNPPDRLPLPWTSVANLNLYSDKLSTYERNIGGDKRK